MVRGLSSAGRAPAWHAGGQRFDPARLHQFFRPTAFAGHGLIHRDAVRAVSGWGLSSAGRAPAWHAGGQRFDPARLHQFFRPTACAGHGLIHRDAVRAVSGWGLSSAGRAPAWHAGGQRFDPARLHHFSSLLEGGKHIPFRPSELRMFPIFRANARICPVRGSCPCKSIGTRGLWRPSTSESISLAL